jgi:hypothetical protein
MRKTIKICIVFCLITISFSCNKANKTEKFKKEIVAPKKIVPNITFQDSIPSIKIDNQNLSFKFLVDTSGYILKKIIVKSNTKIVQSIYANKQIEFRKYSLIDWNFDGYKDITVLYNQGSGGTAYWIWNYNKQKNIFVYNTKLSEVLGLENDSINKKVLFNYREGASN